MGIKGRIPALPSTSLPSLRELAVLSAAQIGAALRNLHGLYCPLPTSLDFQTAGKSHLIATDSGYASEADADEKDSPDCLRYDEFERNFAKRWLTGFIGRAYELSLDESVSERFVDEACSILAFLSREVEDEPADDEDLGMTREFIFSFKNDGLASINVELYDTPMQTGEDHTDVGLQTWGASIALSEKISKEPEFFRFTNVNLSSTSRIVELGAGTGLVSLFLSRLIPHITEARPAIIATDYHPTVLSNLEANINSHMSKTPEAAPIQACHLDWSAPSRVAPLDVPADVLIAADATYAPEHAFWLRDCASSLLQDDGVFWLMVSVRPNGKFADISDTVEVAFQDKEKCRRQDGKVLTIASVQQVAKKGEVGRADEIGYKLFGIVWS
ncbi:Protein-lysine N-methyltransferase EFM2 [Metarhizium anisopliae]|nr:Protein-lysine N-methyltransferase EFM2 [Metarhizium anisopliae]